MTRRIRLAFSRSWNLEYIPSSPGDECDDRPSRPMTSGLMIRFNSASRSCCCTIVLNEPRLKRCIDDCTHVQEDDIEDVLGMLRDCSSLRHLRLSRNYLTRSHMRPLLNGLMHTTSLSVLDLSSAGIQDAGIEVLVKALERNASLQELLLYHNDMTWHGRLYLAMASLRRPGLLVLGMEKVEAAMAIARVQLNDPEHTHLALNGLTVGKDDGEHLQSAVQACKQIKHLSYDIGLLPEETRCAAIDGIRMARACNSFSLQNSSASLGSLLELSETLGQRQVEVVSGHEQLMAAYRLVALDDARCTEFECVGVHCGRGAMSRVTLDRICEALSHNHHLKYLRILDAQLSDEETGRLIQAAANIPTLHELTLKGTSIDRRSIRTASTLLVHHERLVTLWLRLPRCPLAKRLNGLLRLTPWRWFLHHAFDETFKERVVLLYWVLERVRRSQASLITAREMDRILFFLSLLEQRHPRVEMLLDE
ncbi:uncharacterized protein MONBRDRAFT_9234 [Monosiga brevicollis MX1]|uniref:Uncharacterized protein n=1 Tax=Monosiga brevicollis TaxID=81824 RepID=A9V2H9_MONBE|nr:uncharacterized protein MONBRDRAFT_9234 [Monosiga brevicollis MX1]EDQ88380.1 predicted protein [Monosiga brevicollis MX1]|eukprot:XP_001746973.1 hypothetical protein [Monosiga brevicollis MX1]